ncbi:MAG: helix-turn-helix domain-containing protein [Planctomycetia bacterium]|nr:helix-turn-helix domain-containing protein [Planctomycetia bacterium]
MNRKITTLTKLFSCLRQPVYLLNADKKMFYCNDALIRWTKSEEKTLLNLSYSSYLDDFGSPQEEQISMALSPPPEIWSKGRRIKTNTQIDSSTLATPIEFIPLFSSQNTEPIPDFVLAILDSAAINYSDFPFTDSKQSQNKKDFDSGIQKEDDSLLNDFSFRTKNLSSFVWNEEMSSTWQQSSFERDEITELHKTLHSLNDSSFYLKNREHFLGKSSAIRRIKKQINLASHCQNSVLITGIRGSRSEILAETIHAKTVHWLSEEKKQIAREKRNDSLEIALDNHNLEPGFSDLFVPFDCSLFDYERLEAIVLSVIERTNYRKSDGLSTIVLQNVDLLSPEAILFLTDIISSRLRQIRFVGTTTVSANELMRRNSFYYLLSELVIELVPLKDRSEDIPLLAQYYLEDLCRQEKKSFAGFSSEALDLLSFYSWPEDLDELRGIVQNGIRNGKTPLLTASDLSPILKYYAQDQEYRFFKNEKINLDSFLEQIEQELISRAVHLSQGNRTQTANMLGISRPRLYRLMQKYGLEQNGFQDPQKEENKIDGLTQSQTSFSSSLQKEVKNLKNQKNLKTSGFKSLTLFEQTPPIEQSASEKTSENLTDALFFQLQKEPKNRSQETIHSQDFSISEEEMPDFVEIQQNSSESDS